MADDNKAVGPLAAAKLVALIKAETAKKYDKTGGKIDGSAKITGDLQVAGYAECGVLEAQTYVKGDVMVMSPIIMLDDAATDVYLSAAGDGAAKMTITGVDADAPLARLKVATPTGDNDAATKAYVDGKTHDYYDVTVTSAADAAQTIDGGIISVRGSADKTVAEIAAAYAAGKIVRCIHDGNILPLTRVTDGSYTFAGIGANYGVARSGNITITIMSTSSGDATWITSAAGELPIPDSDGSQNGCALVVGDGKWAYSADKLIPATPTSNGLMSAADKAKLDSMDSACYDIYAKIDTTDVRDGGSVYKYGCTVSRTFAEISSAVRNGQTPRALIVDNIDNPGSTRIVCPLSEYDTSRTEGGFYFDAPGLVGVNGSGSIYIDENGAMYTCSAGELPAVNANQDGEYLMIDGGKWTYKRPDTATTTAAGMMSAADKAKLDGIATGANKTVVDAALDGASENPLQNKAIKAALDGKAGTTVATVGANGLMSAADKAKLDGIAAGANKITVDAALDGTSENPVQNKAVKTELDKKLNQSGGTVTGSITLSGAVFADNGLSLGAGEHIHFTKAADDAAKLAHGAADVDDNVPLARLKVAAPTEDNDAATKQYVDALAAENVQNFLNAPVLTSPVMIRKEGATTSSGVYLSTVGIGEKQSEIKLEDVNENSEVAIANLRTPTGTGTDSYAATKGYVDSKVAAGGVTVDTALSGTSTNPVQNKVITEALSAKVNATNPILKDYVYVTSGADEGVVMHSDEGSIDGISTLELESMKGNGVTIGGLENVADPEALGRDDIAVSYAMMKDYVSSQSGSATPITITLGTGGKATSSATYAEISQALTSGRSVMLVGATGKQFWHLLSHTVGNDNNVVLNYAGVSVSGGSLEVTRYTVTVTASGITYSSGSWTNE